MAQADQLVEEIEYEHHAAGLLVVFPSRRLGIGIPAPGRLARLAVAVLGQQIAPVFGRVEPPRAAGHLVCSQ